MVDDNYIYGIDSKEERSDKIVEPQETWERVLKCLMSCFE